MFIGLRRGALAGLLALALLVLLAGPTPAADRKPTARPSGAGKDEVRRLLDLPWHTSVEGALKEAGGKPGQNADRPVFVLRVLGELDGFL
jgi:hypothetical protein